MNVRKEKYMAGVHIYLTEQEQNMVIDYLMESVTTLSEAEDTWEKVDEDMENGLGSALRKIYKGRNGESKYLEYKTKRK